MIKTLVNKFFGGKATKETETQKLIRLQQEQINMLMGKLENKAEQEVSVDIELPFDKVIARRTDNKQTLGEIMITHNVEQIANEYEVETDRKGWDKTANFNLVEMQGLSLANRDDVIVINALVEELRSKIYNTKIDDIFESVEEFPEVVLQQYVLTLQLRDNSYQAEFSNLESLSKKELIETIAHFQFEGFQKVMTERGHGDIRPTEKQIKLLTDNDIDTSKIMTRFKASELINKIMEEKQSGKPSEKQVEYLYALAEKVGYAGYEEMDITTSYKTSQKINELQKIADEKFGDNPLTEEQKKYYANLLKRCNKRLTQARKDEMNALNQVTFKEKVKELKELDLKLNPYLTKGQLDYIVSLHNSLKISYDMDSLQVISRGQATKVIENLNRDLLFQNSRLSAKQYTKEEIKAMPIDVVKKELIRLDKERKERYTA